LRDTFANENLLKSGIPGFLAELVSFANASPEEEEARACQFPDRTAA
jgi:hypothetical protein